MNDKIIAGIISIALCGLIVASLGAVADDPTPSYVVCGQISAGAAHPNGISLELENIDTGETLETTTFEDSNGLDGTYQFNLGNLPSGWERGANITISVASSGHTGSTSATVDDEGSIQQIDFSVSATTGGGGGRERGLPMEPQGGIAVYAIFAALLIVAIGGGLYMYGKDMI